MNFKDPLRNNSDALLQLGAGLLAGRTASEQLGLGMSGFGQARKEAKTRNATLEWLKTNNPELAQMMETGALGPTEAFKMAWDQKLQSQKPKTPIEINGKLVDPTDYHVIADFSTPAAAPETWDTVSPEEAKALGLPPGVYQRSSKSQKIAPLGGTGPAAPNPPAGYTWNDPNDPKKGVSVIPGGPAEKIPSEVAGRLGLSDEFQKNLPAIRKSVKEGSVTGPIDVAAGSIGRNQTYRQIQTGVDSLQRMLTGAGMSISEAQTYANRYLPTMWDSPETLLSKVDQLNAELTAVKERVMAGHGGNQAPAQDQGVVDYNDYFNQ